MSSCPGLQHCFVSLLSCCHHWQLCRRVLQVIPSCAAAFWFLALKLRVLIATSPSPAHFQSLLPSPCSPPYFYSCCWPTPLLPITLLIPGMVSAQAFVSPFEVGLLQHPALTGFHLVSTQGTLSPTQVRHRNHHKVQGTTAEVTNNWKIKINKHMSLGWKSTRKRRKVLLWKTGSLKEHWEGKSLTLLQKNTLKLSSGSWKSP